jgi:hypothetical protein
LDGSPAKAAGAAMREIKLIREMVLRMMLSSEGVYVVYGVHYTMQNSWRCASIVERQ